MTKEITKEAFIKHCKGGKPTKYEGDRHVGMLFEVFKRGEGIVAFCAEALVSKPTFYEWLKAHKEFQEAYDVAINISAKKWETEMITNPDLNFGYWSTIMRNRFGYGKPRIRKLKDAMPIERITAIFEGLEEGELTAQEATQIASVVNTQANILANQTQEPDQFKRNSPEELTEKLLLTQRVIDSYDQMMSKKIEIQQ